MTPLIFASAVAGALMLLELTFWGFGSLLRLFGGVAR